MLSAGVILLLVLVACCPVVLAGGDHGDEAAISEIVSTDGKSGLSLFIADLYNDHRLAYAFLVTTTMAVLGMAVAQIADLVLRALGAQRR